MLKSLMVAVALAQTPAAEVRVEDALPLDAPVSVVVVEQCGRAIGVYATMRDGVLLAFDRRSHISFQAQMDWANRFTGRAIVVEARCVVVPGQIQED